MLRIGMSSHSMLVGHLGVSNSVQDPCYAPGSARVWSTWTEDGFHVSICSYEINIFLTCYALSYVDEAQDNLLIDALGTLPLITMTIH